MAASRERKLSWLHRRQFSIDTDSLPLHRALSYNDLGRITALVLGHADNIDSTSKSHSCPCVHMITTMLFLRFPTGYRWPGRKRLGLEPPFAWTCRGPSGPGRPREHLPRRPGKEHLAMSSGARGRGPQRLLLAAQVAQRDSPPSAKKRRRIQKRWPQQPLQPPQTPVELMFHLFPCLGEALRLRVVRVVAQRRLPRLPPRTLLPLLLQC